jgi:serine/threonine-protein kinase PpkA
MMLRRAALVLVLGLFCIGPMAEVSAQQAARQPLLMEGRTALFQRVILRPGARLAERPDANAPAQPTPGFGVFYVYARQGSGADSWLEIGAAQDGRTQGWVPAERTIDWKQTMVLAFNNPAGRDRAMFFREAETPRALWLNTRGGATEAARLREAARANTAGA